MENCEADNLNKMTSFGTAQLADPFSTEYIPILSIDLLETAEVESLTSGVPWTEPIMRYLTDGDLPSDKKEARKLKYRKYTCIMGDLPSHQGYPIYKSILGEIRLSISCRKYTNEFTATTMGHNRLLRKLFARVILAHNKRRCQINGKKL